MHTHTHRHLLHCLGLSLTLCHWSQRLHFGLSGLCVGSLSLELTPWCHPLTPGTSQSVYQCLQKTRKPFTTLRISLVIFYIFLMIDKSHGKTKTNNELMIVCVLSVYLNPDIS